MTYNTDLMIQVRNQITMDPKSHDQTSYEAIHACGTTRCIAGWAIFFARGEGKSIYEGHMDEQRKAHREADVRFGWISSTDFIAAHHMGISSDEARKLFHEMHPDAAIRKLDELIEKGKNQ